MSALPGEEDAVARYCAASRAQDIDALLATLAPDATLVSPLSGRLRFRGRDDLRVLLGGIYGTLRELQWSAPMGSGASRCVIGECRIAGLKLDDAMIFELDREQRIRRVRPHLRPWLATSLFALVLGPKLARHPGVIWRALRAR